MDNVTIVDVRVEKAFLASAGRRVAGFVDVFNLLNANPEQNTNWSSGVVPAAAQHRPAADRADRREGGLGKAQGRRSFFRRAAKASVAAKRRHLRCDQ